jgi:uncharacterized membrane protein YphA (DoxX/SURF4 family)
MWACATFLAVAFVLVGILKLTGPSAMRWNERFVHWGYPPSARYVVGILEIIGGLGLLIAKSRRAAAATLIALMIGALLTHLMNAEFLRLIPPLVLGGLAFLVYSWPSAPRRRSSETHV